MRDFRQLKVWEKGYRLSLQVYEITKDFPFDEESGKGYILSMNGGLLVTKDRGRSWEGLPNVSDNHFFNGYANKDKFWFIGQRGTLGFYTGETGEIELIESDVRRDLIGISFGSDDFGIIVGASGTVLRTNDGEKWSLVKIQTEK